MKTENLMALWCFQEVEKGYFGDKWVKVFTHYNQLFSSRLNLTYSTLTIDQIVTWIVTTRNKKDKFLFSHFCTCKPPFVKWTSSLDQPIKFEMIWHSPSSHLSVLWLFSSLNNLFFLHCNSYLRSKTNTVALVKCDSIEWLFIDCFCLTIWFSHGSCLSCYYFFWGRKRCI